MCGKGGGCLCVNVSVWMSVCEYVCVGKGGGGCLCVNVCVRMSVCEYVCVGKGGMSVCQCECVDVCV